MKITKSSATLNGKWQATPCNNLAQSHKYGFDQILGKTGLDSWFFFVKFTCFCSISIFLSKHKNQNVEKCKLWNLWFPTLFLYLRINFYFLQKTWNFVNFYKIYLQIWRQINGFCKKIFLFLWLTIGEFSCFSSITLLILWNIQWMAGLQRDDFSQSFSGSGQIPVAESDHEFSKTVINVVS